MGSSFARDRNLPPTAKQCRTSGACTKTFPCARRTRPAIRGGCFATSNGMRRAFARFNGGSSAPATIVIGPAPPRWSATINRSRTVSAAILSPASGEAKMSAGIFSVWGGSAIQLVAGAGTGMGTFMSARTRAIAVSNACMSSSKRSPILPRRKHSTAVSLPG